MMALDGRNRARVIAESLARVIAGLAFVGVVFVPRGPAERPARVDRVR